MFIGRPTKAKLWFFAALSFALSVLMIYSWATYRGIPPLDKLQTATGTVAWVQDGKYGVKFKLNGMRHRFAYASKGRAMGLVYDTLARRDHPVVSVLFDSSHASGPTYSNDKYYDVYELSISGKPFRTHAEIDAAWQADETVGRWLGVVCFFMGAFLSFSAARAKSAT